MKPVAVSTIVARPVGEVFEFLDVLANHAGFMDHMLVDWKFSGPPRGVGAKGEARANTIGSQDWTEFEVVAADPPHRIVEEGVGNGGKRHTRGTYRLERLPDGDTQRPVGWRAAKPRGSTRSVCQRGPLTPGRSSRVSKRSPATTM